MFQNYIGFIDGSVVVLRYKPLTDSETDCSTPTYGLTFRLGIGDWERKFIWVSMSHTASVHGSTALRSITLYHKIDTYFNQDGYVLASKAYA